MEIRSGLACPICRVVEWFVVDGASVREDQVLAHIETLSSGGRILGTIVPAGEATGDSLLCAPNSGVLRIRMPAGRVVRSGEAVARIE